MSNKESNFEKSLDELLKRLDEQTDEEKAAFRESLMRDLSMSDITWQLRDIMFARYREAEAKADFSFEFDMLEFKPRWITDRLPTMDEKWLKEFAEFLASPENYSIPDCELVGTVVKEIKYEPHTIQFKSSGKVILENDLRKYFGGHENLCLGEGAKGNINYTNYFHERGLNICYVGNSCPTFWMSPNKDRIEVGNDYDYDNDEPLIPEGYSEWGYVCTDLWWYSLVDYEVMKKRMGWDDVKMEEAFNILELPKGTWEISHRYGVIKGEPVPYSIITKLDNNDLEENQ